PVALVKLNPDFRNGIQIEKILRLPAKKGQKKAQQKKEAFVTHGDWTGQGGYS
ncbi:MAG: hypothetical protein IT259_20150, partial [Saprospiraceae bacterium]|nr:hypothetical protein [Saprospiraceae bacterium]